MPEDRLSKIEKILERVVKEQELFAKEMRQLRAFQKQTDGLIKKLEERQAKTDAEIDKVAKDIGGGLGRAAEGLTAPSIPKVFKELGIQVKEIHQRVKALQDGKVIAEIDLICPSMLNNKEEILLVGEVKVHLLIDDIKEFIADDLMNFKSYFPKYKDLKVYGLVAGLYVGSEAAKFAYRKGLYVLAPAGETMKLLNPAKFKPKLW